MLGAVLQGSNVGIVMFSGMVKLTLLLRRAICFVDSIQLMEMLESSGTSTNAGLGAWQGDNLLYAPSHDDPT